MDNNEHGLEDDSRLDVYENALERIGRKRNPLFPEFSMQLDLGFLLEPLAIAREEYLIEEIGIDGWKWRTVTVSPVGDDYYILLEDIMLTHKKVQLVYVADVTELFNERKLLLYEMDVPLGTDFKPAQPDAKTRKPGCLVLFYDECETVDIVLKDGSTTRIRKALWTIKLGMVSDEESNKAISPPFMKKPDIE